jgi:hypothetical protein
MVCKFHASGDVSSVARPRCPVESTRARFSPASRGSLRWLRCPCGRIGRVCQQTSHSGFADSVLHLELDRNFEKRQVLTVKPLPAAHLLSKVRNALPFDASTLPTKVELYAHDVCIWI